MPLVKQTLVGCGVYVITYTNTDGHATNTLTYAYKALQRRIHFSRDREFFRQSYLSLRKMYYGIM